MIFHKHIIGLLLLAVGLPHSGVAQATKDQMNILFIAVDDLKPALGCYGDLTAITPNIDALAAEGMSFSRAYCQQAVCAPSRASIMTSRYPDQTGVLDLKTMMREASPGIVSLPEYLITQGFQTTATGKIFDYRSVDNLQDAPSWSRPFQTHYDAKYYDPVNGKPSYYYASPFSKDTIARLRAEAIELGIDPNIHVRNTYHPAIEAADVRYDGYVDGAIVNVGMELLEEMASKAEPFFIGVGFQRPHLPFVAPQEFWDLYDRAELKLAPFREKAVNSPDIAYHNSDELRSYTGIPKTGALPDEQQLELIHGYYAATSYVDFLVGMLIAKLDELNLRENTVIVLWGDHGWHLGDHNLWCKHSNFEEAVHVPLIFSYPGQPNKGSTCNAPVEFTDVAPTLCALSGVTIPDYFQGKSLVPLFEHPDSSIRFGALSQYPRGAGRMGYSLRTERYRLTKWMNPDGSVYSSELYDYSEDPLETISFINDPAYNYVVEELDSALTERIKSAAPEPLVRTPFHGFPFQIPGIIEAEDFDNGGEGLTYHDIDSRNTAGDYRTDVGVDIYDRLGDGFQIGNIVPGEWIEYSVDVAETDTYRVVAHLASIYENGAFTLNIGNTESHTLLSPNSGSWLTTDTVSALMTLDEGEQILRFTMTANPTFNFDKLEFIYNVAVPVDTSAVDTTGIDTTGISEKLNRGNCLTVYQNQQGNLKLIYTGDDNLVAVRLYNVSGRQELILPVVNSEMEIPVTHLKTGNYFLLAKTENTEYYKKLFLR